MNSDTDILLSKWLQGTINDIELKTLSQQFDLDELYELLSKQAGYDLETQDSEKIWDSLNVNLSGRQKPKPSTSWWKYFALGLIAVIGLAVLYQVLTHDNGQKRKIAPKSKTVTHSFVDNSEVILSPGSIVTYDELDWDHQRKIRLQGHAFFKVVNGSPFIVHAGPGSVKVLGTEFEIWEKDGQMKVSCIKGKVEVENFTGDNQILDSGQSVSLNSANLSDVTSHSLINAEFLSGRYNFEKISIVSLASEIERFYNIDVTLKNIDKTINFSGVLLLNDIEKACSYIAETLDLKYERTLQNVTFFKD